LSAAAQLGLLGPASAQPAGSKLVEVKPGANVSLGPLKKTGSYVVTAAYAGSGTAKAAKSASVQVRVRK